MLRNATELQRCRKELIGLAALKRGIARLAKSYSVDAAELESQLDDRMLLLSDQIEQYQALEYKVRKNGPSHELLRFVADLPRALIETRIAVGWSQSDLARYAQTTPQQISKYEKTLYSNISLDKVMEIAKLLDERSNSS